MTHYRRWRSVLPFFAPLAPYCFDDCLWFAELDHVPAFFGDDMGGSRGQSQEAALRCKPLWLSWTVSRRVSRSLADDGQGHIAKRAETAQVPHRLRHLLQRCHFVC